MIASSRSRLAAAAIALLALITGLSHGRLRPLGASGGPAAGPSFFVTNEDDAGPGSLRQAIVDANARHNPLSPDRILFAIPGGGLHTIALRSPLPAITESVVIDGYSQEGARPNALGEVREARITDGEVMIAIDGSGAGDADGLVLLAGDSAVRGLAIAGFTGSGIRIEGPGHNRIEGNVLGAGARERADAISTGGFDDLTLGDDTSGNGGCGITIVASTGNAVGGLEPGARNVIRHDACAVRILGASATGNAILGNSVESDADGIALGDEAARASVPATDQGPNRYRSAPSLRDVERIFPGASGHETTTSTAFAASATIALGTLSSAPRTSFRVELFASDASPAPAGAVSPLSPLLGSARAGRQGARLVASRTVTTSEDGTADLRLEVPYLLSGGMELTATATDTEGNTSEFSLPLVVPGATISWNNAVDGNWDNTANWNPAQVPGAADTADISLAGTYTVNVNANATIAGLTLGGASGTQTLSVNAHTLTLNGPGTVGAHGDLEIVANGIVNGSGDITIDGTLDWTAGSMAGTGSTTVNGILNFSGTVQKSVQRTINSAGTSTWTAGNIRLFAAGGILNSSGTFDAQANTPHTLFDAGTFHNTGLFKRTVGATILAISSIFDNDGTVDVQTGGLRFSGGGGPTTNTGSFDAASATLDFDGGTFNLATGSSITGTDVEVSGGTVNNPGTYNVSGSTSVSSGALHLTGTVTAVGTHIDVSGGTADFSSGETISTTTLTQTAGTLTGSDIVDISGFTTWSAGIMDGAGSTNCNGGLTLDTNGQKGLSRTLNSPAATTFLDGGLRIFLAGGLFNNSGTFDAQADGTGSSVFDAGTFHNTGTFKRTGIDNILSVTSVFDNDGTVDSQIGGLSFGGNGGGPTPNTGSFDATGNLLRFAAGTFNLAASASITGTTVEFAGATVNHAGTYNVTGTTRATAGAAHFTGTVTDAGTALEITNGTLDFSSGEAIQPATLTLTNGTLTGSDTVTVSGLTTWSAGIMDGTGSTNCNGGLTLDTNGQKGLSRTLNSPAATTFLDGGLRIFLAGGLFNNSGTFDAQADGTGSSVFDAGTFHNTGTFKRTGIDNVLSVTSVFDNDGTVDSQIGGLSFGGNGGGPTPNTGSFDATGNLLRFAAGTFNLAASASITGTTVEFAGATVNHAGTYNVTGTTRATAGAAHFTGTVTDAGTALEITNGTLDFSSGEAIQPATLTLTNGTLTGSDTVTVSGLTTWSAGIMDGTGSTNCNGGLTLDTNGQKGLSRTLNSPAATTFLDGSLRIFLAGGLFNNSGTFDAQADGTGSSVFDAGTFQNTGTFKRTGVDNTLIVSSPFTNAGTVRVDTGTLNFSNGYTQTAGTTLLSGGDLQASVNSLNIQGGTLAGSGTITGTVNVSGTGTFSPGTSPGAFSMTGPYAQSGAVSAYTVEIGGTAPSQYDHVDLSGVSGTASLAGGLNVSLVDPFTPSNGDSFTVMTYTSHTGSFTPNLPPLSGGLVWNVVYNPTSLVLSVGGAAASADLSIVKADTPDPVNAGSALAYTLTVTNAGPHTATSLTVTDTLPAGLTSVTGSGTGWTCPDPVAGVLTCTRASLAVATAPVITVVGTAPPTGPLSNTASVSSATSDPVSGNNSDTEGTTVTPAAESADLSIVKADTPDPVNAGSALAYTLTVTNAGPDTATSLIVTDTLPAGLTSVTGSGTGWTCPDPVAGVLTCTRPSLAVATAPVITVTGTAPPTGPLSNTASVSSATSDPVPGNNSDTEGTTVTPAAQSADLSIVKTDSPDPVNAGATLTYTLTVTNTGPDAATALTVADQLPAGLTNAVGSGSGWTCGAPVSGILSCTRPSLAVTTAPVITITATAPAVGPLSNTAAVASTTPDPNANNNTDTEGTTVTPATQSADLSIVKTDLPDPVAAGGTLTYLLAVTNNGPNAATSISVADTLPAGLTNVVGSGNGWTCGAPVSGVLTCTRPSLAIITAPVITITATAPASGPLSNTATVTSATSDPSTANNSDTAGTTVTPSGQGADLAIAKGDDPDPVGEGQPITWTLEVTNAGPAVANRVIVTDTLPPGVSQTRVSGTDWSCNKTVTTIVCARISLAVGPAPTITITAVAPGTAGVMTNQADVSSDTADPALGNNIVSEETTISPVYDIAVLKVKVPSKVKLGGSVTSSTQRIKVQIQNRSPHDETIADEAMLGNLIHVTADSLGDCPDIQGTVLTGNAQTPLPGTLRSKQKVNVWFEVTFSTACINDPAKSSARDPGHEDYQILVTADHAALDGQADSHPADDICPRSVNPPFELDPYPDGSIKDKGCGKLKSDRTFGDPLKTDVWVRE